MIRAAIVYLASTVAAIACGTEGVPLVSETDGAPEAFIAVSAVPLSQPFAVQVTVCGPAQPSDVQVDAIMPAHQHGMNYTPQVTVLGSGRFAVERMVFHMPGLWEIRFEIEFEDRTVSYTHEVTLK